MTVILISSFIKAKELPQNQLMNFAAAKMLYSILIHCH